MCSRLNCRFVHLMESDKVEVCDQRVAVCRDHANGQCKRKQCKYYHIPIVLPPANVMATLFKAQQSQLPSNNNSNNNNNNINTNNNINSNDSKIPQATVATDSVLSSAATALASTTTAAVSTTSTAAATAAATSAAACLLVSETPTTTYSYSEYSSAPRQPVATSASSSINNGNFILTSNASNISDINSNCIPAMTPAACGGNVCTATTSLATINPYGNMNMNLSTIGCEVPKNSYNVELSLNTR